MKIFKKSFKTAMISLALGALMMTTGLAVPIMPIHLQLAAKTAYSLLPMLRTNPPTRVRMHATVWLRNSAKL